MRLALAGLLGGAPLFAGAAHRALTTRPADRDSAGTRIVNRMLETYRSMSSFEQTSTGTVEMATGSEKNRIPAVSRLRYRKPNRFLYQTSAGQEAITIACDGKRMWIYSASRGGYTVQSAPENMGIARDLIGVWGRSFMDAFAFLQGADPLSDARAVRLVGSGKRHGAPVDIVELRGGPDSIGLSDAVTRLYIGRKDHLLYKSETVQKRYGYPGGPGPGVLRVNMSRTITQTHTNIKLNPSLPDGIFTFHAPHGAKQVAAF